MIYIIQILIIFLMAVFFLHYKYTITEVLNHKESFLIVVFFVMALIMGFRNTSVGVDTERYAEWFNIIKENSLIDVILNNKKICGFEFLFRVSMKLSSYICGSYYFFQIIHSIVYCALAFNFLRKNSDNALVSLIVFLGMGFYTAAFNGQRQFLAIMVIINGFTYFKEKKYIKSLIFLAVAPLIHYSSIAFFVAIPVFLVRKCPKFVKVLPVIIVIAALRYKDIIELSKKFFPEYTNYYDNHKTVQKVGGVWIIWLIIVLCAIVSIYGNLTKKKNKIYLYFFKEYDTKNNELRIYALFSLIYVIFNILGLYFNYLQRIGWYFGPFIAIMIDYLGIYMKKNVRKIFYECVIVLFCCYYIYSCFTERAIEYSSFVFC